MHLTLNNCVKSLLKMLTYYMYAGGNDFCVGFCLVLERNLLFLKWLVIWLLIDHNHDVKINFHDQNR